MENTDNTFSDENTPMPPPRWKFSPKLLIVGVVLFLVLIGSAAIFFLQSRSSTSPGVEVIKRRTIIAKNAQFVPDQMIVQIQQGVSIDDPNVQKKLKQLGLISVKRLYPDVQDENLKRYYLLVFKSGSDVRKIHTILDPSNNFESVEPNYKFEVFDTPNDPLYSQQWGPQKIMLDQARNITEGSASVKVAVIDSGVDFSQPDLPANIQKGTDYFYDRASPDDYLGHGTHVMGVIGATTDNAIGVSGMDQTVGLLAIKVCGNTRSEGCTESGIIQGIAEAANKGAKVINMSLGGTEACSNTLQDALNYALGKNVTIVVAAGNSATDASQYQPASCNGVIVVGATQQNDTRATFSNYGSKVDIAAPGLNILSTKAVHCSICNAGRVVNGNYVDMDGTSMAAPFVSGAAALLLAQNPSWTPAQVKQCLVSSGDPITTDHPLGGVRLNIFNALSGCTRNPPPAASSAQYTIDGTVFIDTNKNRKMDAGETGFTNAELDLSGPELGTKTSDANGKFSFDNLTLGQYTLDVKIYNLLLSKYTLTINQSVKGFTLQIPVPPEYITPTPAQGSSNPSQNQTTIPGVSVSPQPSPVVVYTCKMVSQGAAKQSLGLGSLQCTPAGIVQPSQ